MKRVELAATVPSALAGKRLDQALAALFPEHSRARLQAWVKAGYVTVDDQIRRPRERVVGGEQIAVSASVAGDPPLRAEPIELALVHADSELLIIDKPGGLVVHPAAGNPGGTLQNALLHHYPELAAVPRCGLVHRLDKDTSGLIAVARTLAAHTALVRQLQERSMGREYLALVQGRVTAGGEVSAPIGRHPVERKRMAVVRGGREAITHYRVLERFAAHTLLRVRLETGRTHQIRVHLAHLRHPIAGDPVYGGRPRLPPAAAAPLAEALRALRRQFLHAARLSLRHPADGEPASWEAPLPVDLEELLAMLRAHAAEAGSGG